MITLQKVHVIKKKILVITGILLEHKNQKQECTQHNQNWRKYKQQKYNLKKEVFARKHLKIYLTVLKI